MNYVPIATRVTLDIEGNNLVVTDANENTAETNTFAPGGLQLKTESQDAGTRWALPNALGAPLRAWDSRANVRRWTYDDLNRPTHAYLKHDIDDEVLQQRIIYGESLGAGADDINHRGQVYRVYDSAGVQTCVEYDFKGNLLATERRLAEDYKAAPDWIALATETDPALIHAAAAPLLEAETFTTSWTYDALSRVLTQTTPDASVTTQDFGPGGMLNSVAVHVRGAVTPTGIVTNIDYNARGQRTLIEYGNGSTTDYEYDPKTFRVTRIRTIRPNPDPDLCIVQDLRYHYDPVGNIARIRDQAQQGVFFDNAYADPTQSFVYDGLYRLTSATGREHATLTMPTAEGFAPIAHPQDIQAQRNYRQTFTYDPVGNLLRMKHESGMSVVWERGYAYHPGGNQLKATSDPLDDIDDPLTYSVPYTHDAHGNMTAMPTIPGGLTWDDDDRLQSSDAIGGGKTYYVYDGAGQRVRKVHVNLSGSISQQRLYVGSWETYREHKNINTTNDLDLDRETLHVHDDHGRVCLIETKTVDAGAPVVAPANVARYQYSNHLGTANLELDDVAEVISYEEFHPYGTSSYRAANSAIEVSAKRYRYTGQERDEETGLAYHGARYYAPWLCRWIAADPTGIVDGIARYTYVSCSPIRFHDPDGTRKVTTPGSDELMRQALALQGPPLSSTNGAAPSDLLAIPDNGRDWVKDYAVAQKRGEAAIQKHRELSNQLGKEVAKGVAKLYAVGAVAGLTATWVGSTAVVQTALEAGGAKALVAETFIGTVSGAAGGATEAGLTEASRQLEEGVLRPSELAKEIGKGAGVGSLIGAGTGLLFGLATRAITPRTPSASPASRPTKLTNDATSQASTEPTGTGNRTIGSDAELLAAAESARDTLATQMGPMRRAARPAAVTAGYNIETGQIAAQPSGNLMCAEKRVVQTLGGDIRKVRMTSAVRPRPQTPPFAEVPVCTDCEFWYGRSPFPSGTRFQGDEGHVEIDRHNWNQLRAAPFEHAEKIPEALNGLIRASNTEEADHAYWKLDNVVIVQGMLHESALAACSCLVVGLGRATPSARPRMLELMVQIGGGEPSRQEIQQNRSDLHALCLRELKHGYALYLDILERGTQEEQVHCVDLLGMCAEEDPSLRPQVVWHLTRYASTVQDSILQEFLKNWLDALSGCAVVDQQ
ncbi:RHS repeat-associated core domain-containing protein [Nannocystis pusilla]|uniref:RHS repeat-associated core domain-containing protein n=1 Tax=Nannocystis pusilla TaxID=889268 RepID=A0A9X3F5M4_9BACT|nr:RHS repeat-associated core domain-containing protein [Nannocystis pusilla]MCY1012048.1 RHS repeat-associated core domain-containing protein [Nannocystis pusilla]